MRKVVFLLVLFLFLGLSSCQNHSGGVSSSQLLALVPPKTAALVKANNLSAFAESLEQNTFVNANQQLPVHEFLSSFSQTLEKLELSDRSLVLFSRVGRKVGTTLLTPLNSKLLDDVGYEEIDGFTYNRMKVKTYTIKGKTIYGVKLNGLFAFGDSKLVIENIIRLYNDNLSPDEKLKKIYKSSSDQRNAIFVNTPEFQKIYAQLLPHNSSEFLKDFTDWVALDIEVEPHGIYLNGASIPQRSDLLGLFRNTKPSKNELAQITPVKSTGFYSFTYDDFEELKHNLYFFRNGDYPKIDEEVLQATQEIGQIYNGGRQALVLKSGTPDNLESKLKEQREFKRTYRNRKVYAFSGGNYFYKALHPLVELKNIQYYSRIGRFFVFAQDQSTLENIIANEQNKTVLGRSEAYRKTTEKQDEKSSFLVVGITDNLINSIANGVRDEYRKAYEKTDMLGYKFASLQFINHENYTYVNGVFSESTGQQSTSDSGVQIGSIKAGEEIVSGPWFFVNWRTKHYDIVFQGKSNKLYVYNEKGVLRWKKQLDGKILGDLQQIDIYQNKRIQMAFVTPHTFYIIDRDGKVVKPFEKTFEKPITQPLAVFDYSDNGRFRFIITQNDKLTMLDKHLGRVKGFEKTATASPVLHAPKHYRIGNKDYILLTEKSGNLHILNPRGQTRVKVNQKLDFSDNDWYLYHNQFTSTNQEGALIQINPQGKKTKKDLDLADHHHLDATAKTLVTFSENKLTIKGKTTVLDYGLYTRPKIFYIQDKIYIAITDTQAHKVYLFDSASNLISGFPVYGNSAIDLQPSGDGKSKRLIVQGEDKGILIYEVE